MARWTDDSIKLKNNATVKANDVIEITQKDNFKHFQRINRSVLESNKNLTNIVSYNHNSVKTRLNTVIFLLIAILTILIFNIIK